MRHNLRRRGIGEPGRRPRPRNGACNYNMIDGSKGRRSRLCVHRNLDLCTCVIK